MKIGIIGCSGRMGQALVRAANEDSSATLTGGTVRTESTALGQDIGSLASIDPIGINTHSDMSRLFEESDAVIDFTSPETSLESAKAAAKSGTALVIGTTGFTKEQFTAISEHAQKAPIVWSANMSIGVNILTALTERVAQTLGTEYDIEIVEMHHRNKVDSPSGTALALGEAAAKGRQVALDEVACKSRDGIIGKRPSGEIGFATLRGGDVIGEHSVIFAGTGERIELTHKASDRQIFARGAVKAALWSASTSHGLYTMKDVLGL